MWNQDPNSLSRRPRVKAGGLAPFVETFAEYLAGLGHSRLTVSGFADSACHFADWLGRVDITASDVSDEVIGEFARHRCQCPGGRRGKCVSPNYVRRVRRFVRFLAESGVVAKPTPAYTASPYGVAVPFNSWKNSFGK